MNINNKKYDDLLQRLTELKKVDETSGRETTKNVEYPTNEEELADEQNECVKEIGRKGPDITRNNKYNDSRIKYQGTLQMLLGTSKRITSILIWI